MFILDSNLGTESPLILMFNFLQISLKFWPGLPINCLRICLTGDDDDDEEAPVVVLLAVAAACERQKLLLELIQYLI